MKKKFLTIIALPLLLISCGNNKCPVESSSVVDEEQAIFEHINDLANFKNNTTFTSYRLTTTIVSSSNNEVVFNQTKRVNIDRTNNYFELIQTTETISQDYNSLNAKKTVVEHYYFDQGSTYVLQDDESYKQIDGTVKRSSLEFKLNMDKSYFSTIETCSLTGNVYKFLANIDSTKANDLFSASNLSNIQNGKMELNGYDNNLENLKYSYELNQTKISTNLNVYYNAVTIELPSNLR